MGVIEGFFNITKGLFMASSNSSQSCALFIRQPQLFPLGQLAATPGSLEVLESLNVLPLALIRRHSSGDWGTIHEEDRELNALALTGGGRLMSVYNFKKPIPSGDDQEETIWIITEADRSVTTILLPSEY